MIGSKKSHRAVMMGFGSKRKSKLGDSQMSILQRAKEEKRFQLGSRGESFYQELFKEAAERKHRSSDEVECA